MKSESFLTPGVSVQEGVPLASRTTLRIGGPARFLAEVADAEALAHVLRVAAGGKLPVLTLGRGSNLLVPDAGFPGVVLVLGGAFRKTRIEGTEIVAGGGVSLMSLAALARDAGLSGLENLSGIPSSLGGAVRINAGSYGSAIFDVLVSHALVSRAGRRADGRGRRPFAHAIAGRPSAIPATSSPSARFLLSLKSRGEIASRMAEVAAKRRAALPKQPNAGSIFKNPPGAFAGKLLEECGLKGRRIGGAEVSTVHANVIVNAGGATAQDVKALMSEMKKAVRERFGIDLQPEIQIVG